jgi:hypothetical protein
MTEMICVICEREIHDLVEVEQRVAGVCSQVSEKVWRGCLGQYRGGQLRYGWRDLI